jgi:transcription initiation factor TFIIIB Brf1 subunit/transcription initiation factor TFIIB
MTSIQIHSEDFKALGYSEACPHCGHMLIHDNKEIVCTYCGAVCGFDPSQEPSYYKPNFVNSYYNSKLGSVYHTTKRMLNPRLLNEHKKVREARLLRMVELVSEFLKLPGSTKEIAIKLALKILRMKCKKTPNLCSISIYAILQACRSTFAMRSLNQIYQAHLYLGYKVKGTVFKELSRLSKRFSISYLNSSAEDYIAIITSGLEQYISDIKYVRNVYAKAKQILEKIRHMTLGKNPINVAACCILAADKMMGSKIGLPCLLAVTGLSRNCIKRSLTSLGLMNQEVLDNDENILFKIDDCLLREYLNKVD